MRVSFRIPRVRSISTCLYARQIFRAPVKLRSRSFSTAPAAGATTALQTWIGQITAQPPSIHTEAFDPLRAAQLLRTLPTRQYLPAEQIQGLVDPGRELGQGHHMVYFQPETMLRDLGADGSSPEYNAPEPYTRRMWAGGSMSWSTPLRIGDRVIERRSIAKVEYKKEKDMVFIHQKRELFSGGAAGAEGSAAVTEIRTHVFRPPGATPSLSSTAAAKTPMPTQDEVADLSFTYTPTAPLLFRYSALTFNAHRIHYDRHHTTSVERQPDVLVHGPLTATLLIELASGAGERRLSEFTYRAVSPIVVDREVQLLGWWRGGVGQRELELEARQEGRVGMKATARLAPQP